MQFIVPCANSMHLKSFLRYTFLILENCHPDTLYSRKYVRIRGYFSKTKLVCELRYLGKAELYFANRTGSFG